MLEERSLKLDLFALVLLALAVFLTLALATYDPADSTSGLVYPPHAQTVNACGRSGSIAADLLLEALGLGAYCLVISMIVVDALLLCRRRISHPIVRAVGWLLSLIGLTTLAAMTLTFSPGRSSGSGGYLGAAGRGLLEMHCANAGRIHPGVEFDPRRPAALDRIPARAGHAPALARVTLVSLMFVHRAAVRRKPPPRPTQGKETTRFGSPGGRPDQPEPGGRRRHP